VARGSRGGGHRRPSSLKAGGRQCGRTTKPGQLQFGRAGIDISGHQKTAGPTAKVPAAARAADAKIIYLKMGYKPDLSDLSARHSTSGIGFEMPLLLLAVPISAALAVAGRHSLR
jgi:hypothetical protein